MPSHPFQNTLLSWYQRNKRDLPWRQTNDPYQIWLSEIILQQTRVEQGMPYYRKFVEAYPDVRDLAHADEDEVLKNWEGLGYYSRARNLHHAAKQVLQRHNGSFPTSYHELIQLKGVGDYTASAVSSIAAAEPHAVVDGNVYRVLARYFGLSEAVNSSSGQKSFKTLAQEVLDYNDPGTFNQALMEFGALQCVPRNPDCGSCPLRDGCKALQLDKVDHLPVKIRKNYDRVRYLNYLILSDSGKVYAERRSNGDIWGNLYQFWLYESTERKDHEEVVGHFQSETGAKIIIGAEHQLKPHKLSHQTLHISIWEAELAELGNPEAFPGDWLDPVELEALAFPKPLRAFLDRNQLTLPLG